MTRSGHCEEQREFWKGGHSEPWAAGTCAGSGRRVRQVVGDTGRKLFVEGLTVPVKEVRFHYKYNVTLVKLITGSDLLQFTCYNHFGFSTEDRRDQERMDAKR